QPDASPRRRSETMDLVNRYASALSRHPTPVEAVGEVAGEILEQFDGARPDLLVYFVSPHHAGAFEDVMGGLRKVLEPEAAIGCTMVGVAGGGLELAGQPAMARLQEIVQTATDAERALMRDGLHLGVVVDEHKLDFTRGDFLVRNLLGADRSNGAIAIGDRVDVGTTVQFQVRDAE